VLELILLLIFMVLAGIVAVEIKDLLASVIALGAVGFAVAIGFIRLAAPDLAIVQIVIEVLSVVFFVAVILKTTHVDSAAGRPYRGGDIFTFVVFGLFAIAFIYFGVRLFATLAPVGRELGKIATHYLTQGLTETKAVNRVAAVILDYRGLDTLGEATVLFTAVIGALSVLRFEGRKK
jgi:multicomponent Na+:H+ antiporter subunit B